MSYYKEGMMVEGGDVPSEVRRWEQVVIVLVLGGRETQPPGFIYTVTILAKSIACFLVLGIAPSMVPSASGTNRPEQTSLMQDE